MRHAHQVLATWQYRSKIARGTGVLTTYDWWRLAGIGSVMMLGTLGLIFELSTPGAILPGVIGGISLILAFFAFQSLPINFAGLLLILFFSVYLGWLPFVYDSTVSGFWPNLKQSIMPMMVLAMAQSLGSCGMPVVKERSIFSVSIGKRFR